MIYISIDIETSGLDPSVNKILSIGAIIEDTEKKLSFEECPKFNIAVIEREIIGSPRAISMNMDLINQIADYLDKKNDDSDYLFLDKKDIAKEFYKFVLGKTDMNFKENLEPITINVAGKNFSTFDNLFLNQLPFWKKLINIRQRVLDPAILYVDWKNDDKLPSLGECKDRAGINGIVTHNALEDAWDVIQVLRNFY